MNMRKREVKKVRSVVETGVICDECGENCKNTNTEILIRHSFSDGVEHYKDVCWKCYEKLYKTQLIAQRDKDMKELLKTEHDIPMLFETDVDEVLDFVKHKRLSKEFAEWKVRR